MTDKKEVNKNRLQHLSVFKRGYAEGTYYINVLEFVLILTTALVVINVSKLVAGIIFASMVAVVIIVFYVLGRWNMNPDNKLSILRQDMIADPGVQAHFLSLRDLEIAQGLNKSAEDISFWMSEPLDVAQERVVRSLIDNHMPIPLTLRHLEHRIRYPDEPERLIEP